MSADKPMVQEERCCIIWFDSKQWSPRYAKTFFTAYAGAPNAVDEQNGTGWEIDENDKVSGVIASQLPIMPAKTWMSKIEDAFVRERHKQLSILLIQILGIQSICQALPLRAFLGLDVELND